MLSLQSNINDNPIVKQVFQDSQKRIESMAAVHRLFYKSENLSDIRISDYIYNLVLDLVNSYKGVENNITIDIQVPEINYNVQKAIPLGLFINEIITNSLKHAFYEQTSGKISIILEQQVEKRFTLKISDNGIGFDESKEIQNDTLGLVLIENLASQLEGKLERSTSSEGTTYIFSN
jgi:two-component sensor histidine kinase